MVTRAYKEVDSCSEAPYTDWRWLLNLKAEDALFPENKKSNIFQQYILVFSFFEISWGDIYVLNK